MTAFFDTEGDLWFPIGGNPPDDLPAEMVKLLTFVPEAQPGGDEARRARGQPAMYLNLTRYVLRTAMASGCG